MGRVQKNGNYEKFSIHNIFIEGLSGQYNQLDTTSVLSDQNILIASGQGKFVFIRKASCLFGWCSTV
jgi:hypothetical protein